MSLQEKFEHLVFIIKSIPLPEHCICITDIHAGSGKADPLAGSGVEDKLIHTLNDYFNKGYTLLKNGDWWDTWRAHDLIYVWKSHAAVAWVVDTYQKAGRLYETLGNHERDLCSYPIAHVFKGFGKKIFMDHGYLGDVLNDTFWEESRAIIRSSDKLGIDPNTSPHPSNPKRHEAVKKLRKELADANPEWDFLWGHTHFFENIGNSHNSGSLLCGKLQGYLIEKGNFISL